MKPVLTMRRTTRCLASLFALLGASLTLGGSLLLAGYYAQTGASLEGSYYYAAGQPRHIDCADNGNPRAAVATPRSAS
jgi:hypothetical protein